MAEGIAGSYSPAYSYYYPNYSSYACYPEEEVSSVDSNVSINFSQPALEDRNPPPSLAQGALGGVFSLTSLACDCHGIILEGDGGGFDYHEDVEAETSIDTDGDSMPDEVLSDALDVSDTLDGDVSECEWELLGDSIRITDDINRTESSIPFVWTGLEYGVSWGNNSEVNPETYFTRLDGVGNKIGTDIRVARTSSIHPSPESLIWTGSEYGIFGDLDGRFFAGLYGEGAGAPRMPSQTTVVWTGSEYGSTWSSALDPESYGIYFARLDSEGNLIGENTRVTSTYSYHPSLAWTGSEYGVCWADERNSSYNSEIYFARLAREGNIIGDDVRITNANGQSFNPDIIWTGSEHAVVWSDTRVGEGAENTEIYFTRLDNLGNKISEDVRLTNDTVLSWGANISWAGYDYGLVWSDVVDIDTFGLHFARLSNSGITPGSELLISVFPGTPNHSRASLTWTGTEFGIIWREENNLYFNRVGCISGGSTD